MSPLGSFFGEAANSVRYDGLDVPLEVGISG